MGEEVEEEEGREPAAGGGASFSGLKTADSGFISEL